MFDDEIQQKKIQIKKFSNMRTKAQLIKSNVMQIENQMFDNLVDEQQDKLIRDGDEY